MAGSAPVSGSLSAPEPGAASRSTAAVRLWDDGVLRIAFLTVGLLLAYQLAVILLQPAWIDPVTDWLQALVAWLGVLVVVLVSLRFTQMGELAARFWWLMSAGLLSYAVGRIVWLVEDQFLFPHHVPIPSWSDVFFVLQYPCYLLALLLLPRVHAGMRRTLVMVDACLLLGAAFALSWYFLLAPIYLTSHETLPAKLVNLSYPVGDLGIFLGLTLIWLRYRQYVLERAVMALLIVAVVCLVVADSWTAIHLLNMYSYQTGSPPDLFWMAFYLLVPLAALVRVRLTQRTLAGVGARQLSQQPTNLRRQDLLASIRFTLPVAAALLACVVLLIRAALNLPSGLPPRAGLLIVLGLLVLAVVRQGLTVADNERLRREREGALREAKGQMEAFLGIAAHELKNPLASMQLCLEVVEQRIQRQARRTADAGAEAEQLLEPLSHAEHQEERIERLVNDLVDVSRVQAGKLEVHLAPTDLAAIVREAVDELRQVYPERKLLLVFPADLRVPVMADAYRLGQVVTNYLTNALKYSAADRSVTVNVAVEGQAARVAVRDDGPGIPANDQERIWERYHRVKGIEVQSGTGVGLGLGLPICRAIIEQHQGQVGVQSAPGHGSTFWFSLPLAPAEPAFGRCEADAPEGSPGDGERQS
jgi:signal transduction histidine kinase